MSDKILGASPWEQELYDHVVRHLEDELAVIQAYEQLADRTESPAFAYLARIILDDERRHHALLRDLADSIRSSAELSNEPPPIPTLDGWAVDAAQIAAETERYLQLEKRDNKELDALVKDLHDVRTTTLWELIVRLMRFDNDKHQCILKFIEDQARSRPTS